MSNEKDYFLGTHDAEIARLGLQHRVWRPRTLDAWRRAGFTVGQTILDIGCGPGYASLDLAEIVGPSGKVIAVDRSERFLESLQKRSAERGLGNIEIYTQDLDDADLPGVPADGAWCRWVYAFVKNPRQLLARAGDRLKKGGVIVIHEYFDYSTWRMTPRSHEFEEFVRIVTESWRADGGEPDIGLNLMVWLGELGFETKSLLPIVDIVPKSNYIWQWPKAFIDVGLKRLVDLGRMAPERAEAILRDYAAAEVSPQTLMITPGVVEIIAMKK